MTSLQLEIELKNYCDYPTTINLEKVLQKLATIPLSILNNYCIENNTIRELLAYADFQPFWQQKMAGIKVRTLPDFTFHETSSLNAFQITLGYFNYFQALKNPAEQTKYIHQALIFHSFQALNHFAEEFILQFQDKKESLKQTIEAIPYFEKEAVFHGTPGFLIVALLYYRLALAYKSLNPERARSVFQLVIKNLEFAILAEKNSSSELNNAYFGQDLAQTNPFNQPTLKAIRYDCILKAGACLNQIDIEIAKKAAALNFPIRASHRLAQAKINLSKIEQAILAESHEAIDLVKSEGLNKINKWEESSLAFAVRHKKINSVRYLLSQGVPVNDATALRLALTLEHQGLCRLLLQPIYNLHNSDAENSALSAAIMNADTALITSILESGVSPDLILPNGRTGFEHLVSLKNHDCIVLFLDYGVSLASRNSRGETILFSLFETENRSFEEHKMYFRRFINLGADLNAQNNQGETILCKAVKRSDLNAVIFLLSQPKIDLDLKDIHGCSALEYADRMKNQWISSLIRQHSNAINRNNPTKSLEIYQKVRFFTQGIAAQKNLQAASSADKNQLGFTSQDESSIQRAFS
ncbi:MAG: DUF5630 domain-containing protein [Tatlockia sp.]|nr:DUF5630 domain-containing protein [Tatlockia sp.]